MPFDCFPITVCGPDESLLNHVFVITTAQHLIFAKYTRYKLKSSICGVVIPLKARSCGLCLIKLTDWLSNPMLMTWFGFCISSTPVYLCYVTFIFTINRLWTWIKRLQVKP